MGEEFDITMGQSPPGTSYNEMREGTAFFQGKTDFGFRFPENRIYCTEPKRFANKNYTLLSVRAPVGEINIAVEKCCIGRGVAGIIHKKGYFSYTYYILKGLREEFNKYDKEGTVFGSINKDSLENIKTVIPFENIIGKYQEKVGSLDNEIYELSMEIKKLTLHLS